MKPHADIEPLEARIAPAVLIGMGGHTASYVDVDGDKVTVAVSLGTLTSGLFTMKGMGAGEQLQMLDLSGGGFDNANVTFSVAKAANGDGLANVGFINSTGHDLGKVTVKGDLGRIAAGDMVNTTPGLKSLSVRSLGRLGIDTQMAGGNLQTIVSGPLGSLAVTGDVQDAYVFVSGGGKGSIGAITIGGSLIGGKDSNTGYIYSDSDVGPVKIGRDLLGGAGQSSGYLTATGKIGSVSIGGSFLGSAGNGSGTLYSGASIGAVKIGRDFHGGSGPSSGSIQSTGALGNVTIGGSFVGGSDSHSGQIYSGTGMGLVKIAHDMQGGSGTNAGLIQASTTLAGVTIGGSFVGGSDAHDGHIYSNSDMGPVKIGHDLQGGTGTSSGFIQSNGKLASVTIGGSLVGGTAMNTGQVYANGDIGAVKIGRDLTGGSITGAMTLDSSGIVESFGGRIASVTIGGSIISGTDTSTGDLIFSATIRAGHDIGSLTVAGSLMGHADSGKGAAPVVIAALGQATQGAKTDLAIGKISIGGRVENANIFAGFNLASQPANGDAQIGAVTVGGDWVASNLIAGANNLGANNAVGGTGVDADYVNWGDAHDLSAGAGTAGILSRIASITIKGQVFGTPNAKNATDSFGFVAEQIGSVKIGARTVVLSATAHTDNLAIGQTTDFHIHEV